MVDIASILALISTGVGTVDGVIKTIQGAKDLAKKESTDPSAIAIGQQLAAAYEQMVQVKQAQLALLQAAISLQTEKAAFEKEKGEIDEFQARRDHYILTELGPHSFAYGRHRSVVAGEPAHYACARCFGEGKFSLLQLHQRHVDFDTLKCQRCNSTVHSLNDVRAEVRTATRARTDWDPFDY